MHRTVTRVVTAHQQREGGGFVVRRPFPTHGLDQVDPLLMLDELGPVTYGPGQAIGAPDHPHRGFETVTYILEGESEHADSAGHAGTLGPGDVQWMTAGAGVVHREMPSRRMQAQGGTMHGFQLWVNLPAALKLTPPRYQELRGSSLPVAESPDGACRVLAVAGRADLSGSGGGAVEAAIRTHTPILYLHIRLAPGGRGIVAVPAGHNACVYVFEGQLQVGGSPVGRGQLALLGPGDAVDVESAAGAQALLLGGRPLGEPVARYGPFVMNSEAELRQAVLDYQAGRMGRIPPEIIRA